MVRDRINSSTSSKRWADEHILVIGTLPFSPLKDGTSGPSSWKPVKDLVRFCMAQSSGDDPKVEIRDYCFKTFLPQAFVKLKKEENANLVFERIAGNLWYGTVLQVWWFVSPNQLHPDRPAELFRYGNQRECPESLEQYAQIRDEKLLHRGVTPSGHQFGPPMVSPSAGAGAAAVARGGQVRSRSHTSNSSQICTYPIDHHHHHYPMNPTQPWPNPEFNFCPPIFHHQQHQHGQHGQQQWPSANPPATTPNNNTIQQYLYEVPISMLIPLSPNGITTTAPPSRPGNGLANQIYPIPIPAPVSVSVLQQDCNGVVNGGSGGAYGHGHGHGQLVYPAYVPPPSSEYSYPNGNGNGNGNV